MAKYNETRAKLATAIETSNRERTIKQIKSITDIKDEGKRKNEIWALRKRLSKKAEINQHLISEEGEKITGETETKEKEMISELLRGGKES